MTINLLGNKAQDHEVYSFEPMIEHLFHRNLIPIGLVIEIEAANENLPSKNAQYRHVPTILQK